VNFNTIDALTGLRLALEAPNDQRLARFEQDVMGPLRPFWEPFLAMMPGAKDRAHEHPAVAAAKTFNFFTPDLDVSAGLQALDRFGEAKTWPESIAAVERAWAALAPEEHGIELATVRFAFMLGDPAKLNTQGGYTGFGGMPGLVMVLAWPTDENLAKLPAAGVHELHHNVRFSFEPFHPIETTVGQYIVAEGLAEAFAAEICGQDKLGPWATALSTEQLIAVKPRFRESLELKGFNQIRGYIFGDWAAEKSGYEPVGLPDFAGYAIGYDLIRTYLDRTSETAAETTYVPWREVIEQSQYFA
jgi:uncharacterized protein YjaZ